MPEAVLDRVRRICLALPETEETDSWGHPNFRAGRRIFATFEWFDHRPSIAFRLGAERVEALVSRTSFFPTPYGRGQWVSVWADGPVNWSLVERLLLESYRGVALKRMIAKLDGLAKRGKRSE